MCQSNDSIECDRHFVVFSISVHRFRVLDVRYDQGVGPFTFNKAWQQEEDLLSLFEPDFLCLKVVRYNSWKRCDKLYGTRPVA